MPMPEHPDQSWLNHPGEQRIRQRPAARSIFQVVCEARLPAQILEFMTVNPSREGTRDLFVDEKVVLLVGRV